MFPDNPTPDRSLIAFPGFPVPSKAVQGFPGFPTIGIKEAVDLFAYLDGWNQSQIYEVTLDSSFINEDLTNFPVLINLTQVPVVWNEDDKNASISLEDSDTTAIADTTAWKSIRNISGKSEGKWYFEVKIKANSTYNMIGVMTIDHTLASYVGSGSDGWGYNGQNGYSFTGAVSISYGTPYTTDDVIGVAVDFDTGKLYFAKNNVWQKSADLDAGTGFAYDTLSGTLYPTASPYDSGNKLTILAEPSGCTYAPPTDYVYWNDNPSYSDLFDALIPESVNEVLLIHSNTTDSSTTFVDSSVSAHTVTPLGNSHHETTWAKFGATSIELDGTGDYLSIPDSPDFALGSGAFTLDLHINPKQIGKTQRLLSKYYIVGAEGWFLTITTTNYVNFTATGDVAINLTSTSSIAVDTPMHIAVVRNGDDFDLYINGTSEDSATETTTLDTSTVPLFIGRLDTQTIYDANMYLDEIRLLKGTARWTGNFTPLTYAYPEILDISEVAEKLAITDVNSNQLYVEVQEWDAHAEICLLWAGVPIVESSEDTKLYLYYDVEYDPVNYVTAKSVILDFSASNQGGGADPYDYFGIRSIEFKYKGELVTYDIGDVAIYATSEFSATYAKEYAFDQTLLKTGAWADKQWLSEVDGGGAGLAGDQRLVIVFEGTEKFDEIIVNNGHNSGGSTLYAVKETKIYYSTDIITSTTYGAIISNSELLFDGDVVEHIGTDIEHSQVVYKTNPTDEQTGATLLISSDTVDADAVSHDTSFNGYALTPTLVTHEDDYAKFGNTSMAFLNATSDLDVINDGGFDFGTDAFTIDFWIWKSSFAGNSYMFDIGTNGSRFTMNAGTCFIYAGGTAIFIEGSVPPVSQWNHIALTNDGAGTYYLFFNGVLIDSTANAVAFGHATSLLTVGNYGGGTGYSIAGYLEEFRIIKGTCAWTEDFVPPPAPYVALNEYLTGTIGSISGMQVWDDNFKVVYHMNQDPSGGTDCMLDSTGNANHGTPSGTMLTEDLVDGVIGKAIDFDGVDDKIVSKNNIGISGGDERTLEIITRQDVVTEDFIGWGGASTATKYSMYTESPLSDGFRIGVIGGYRIWGIDLSLALICIAITNADAANTATLLAYNEGEAETATATSSTTLNTTDSQLHVGNDVGDTTWGDGVIDEVRVSNIQRTAAWLKATAKSNRNLLLTIAKKE